MNFWRVQWTRQGPLALVGLILVAVSCGDSTRGAGTPTPAETPPTTFEAARDAAFALEQRGAADAVVREALLVAYALKPEAYGVNVKLGQVCERLELPEEAAAAYSRARATRPEDVATLQALATQLVEAGDWEGARAVLPELAAQPGQDAAVLLLEARMLESGAPDDVGPAAAALLERALALPPELSAEAQTVLGRWMLEHGAFEDARVAFLAALAQVPDDTAVLKGLSAACWRLGLEGEAQRWQEVLTLMLGLKDNVFTREQTTSSGAANQLSAIENSEYIRREIEAHGERLARLIEIHPDWPEGFLDLAELQAHRGDHEAACSTMEAYLRQHGAGLSAAEQRVLLDRYCR